MFEKPKRNVHTVFIHCSATDNPAHDDINVIKSWHLNRGFSDVGYHYFIHKNGGLSAGRSLEIDPAAQRGHNTGTIAICVHGLAEDKFTELQYNTLKYLVYSIQMEYVPPLRVRGHCEVSPKACPVFDYKTVLSLDENGHI